MTPEEYTQSIIRHLENPTFPGYTILMPVDVIRNALTALFADAINAEREGCAELVMELRDDELVASAIRARGNK